MSEIPTKEDGDAEITMEEIVEVKPKKKRTLRRKDFVDIECEDDDDDDDDELDGELEENFINDGDPYNVDHPKQPTENTVEAVMSITKFDNTEDEGEENGEVGEDYKCDVDKGPVRVSERIEKRRQDEDIKNAITFIRKQGRGMKRRLSSRINGLRKAKNRSKRRLADFRKIQRKEKRFLKETRKEIKKLTEMKKGLKEEMKGYKKYDDL